MSPKDESLKKNETEVYRNLYGDLSALEPQRPKFKVGDNVRISKKTNNIFEINAVQMTIPVTYELEDSNKERLDGSFCKAELQKMEQMFRIEEVLRRDKKNDMALVNGKDIHRSLIHGCR